MHVRLALVALSLGSLAAAGCFRNLKKDTAFVNDPTGKDKVVAPTPPLPTGKALTPAPSAGGVKPPKLELAPGTLPPLPGMPGTPSNSPPVSVPDAPKAAPRDADDELLGMDDDPQRKGILQRLRERREEKEKEKKEREEKEKKDRPVLPPAVEPKKSEPDRKPAVDPQKGEPDKKLILEPEPKPQPKPTASPGDLKTVRGLVDEAAKRFVAIPDFESKLTKRETVSGKKQPTEEMRFLFRQEPFSVRLTVTGEHGRGREVVFVKGQNNGKLIIVTGEGDNRLLGAGKKLELDPDNPLATSRTRGKIEDSGIGRPIRVLSKFVEEAEAGKRPADSIRSLGKVERKEFGSPVDGVEVTLKTSDDPLMPKGGKRQYYFDVDPKSPSYRLPVLVITSEPDGAEVEYYCFTDFKAPAKLTDADFVVKGKR